MFFPKEELRNLEKSLKNISLEENNLIQKIENFYGKRGIQSPGVESEDFVTAILNPIKE